MYDRDADLERLVDALELAPNFVQHASRRLLVARVGRYLGGRLFVPEYDIARDWFADLVGQLDERPGGLAALTHAVAFAAPGSRTADLVSARVTRLTVATPSAEGGGTLVGSAPDARSPMSPSTVTAPEGPPPSRDSALVPGSVGPPRSSVPESLSEPSDLEGPPGCSGSSRAAGPLGEAGPTSNGRHPEPSAGPPAVRPGPAEHSFLSTTEVAELARLFAEPADAIRLLVAAGIPRARVPTWGTLDADRYWYGVAEQLRDGLLPNARVRVLDAAFSAYPGNVVFGGACSRAKPTSGEPV